MELLFNILFILSYISHFAFGFAFFYISNYGITLLDLTVIALYFILLFAFFILGKKLRICINYPNVLLFSFNIALLLSAFKPLWDGNAQLLAQFIKTTSHYYYIVFFLLLIYFEWLKPKTFHRTIQILIWAIIVLNLFGIYQLFARALNLPLAWIELTNKALFPRIEVLGNIQQSTVQIGSFYRVTSIFTEPSVLASFNVYLLIFLIIPWVQFRESYIKSNKLLISFISISIITLFLTYSMTGFMGVVGVLLAIIFLEKLKSYKLLIKVVLIIVTALLVVNFILIELFGINLFSLFSYRIESVATLGGTNIKGESLPSRLRNVTSAIEVWAQYPIFGVGLGLLGYQKNFPFGFSDVTIISILSESGIINFILFIAFMISLLVTSIKVRNRTLNLAEIPLSEKKLIGIAPYVVTFEILRCFFAANILIHFILWFNLAYALYPINRYGVYLGYNYINVSLRKLHSTK